MNRCISCNAEIPRAYFYLWCNFCRACDSVPGLKNRVLGERALLKRLCQRAA